MPAVADAETLHSYAHQQGGLQGIWVPLQPGTTKEACDTLVADWMAGWRGVESYHGPTFVITRPADDRLIGVVTFGEARGGVIEIAYGTAPDHRGRGVASEAARLAADWLLGTRLAVEVELRIGKHHAESQRVAAKAGYRLVGTVLSHVPATGETHEDLRYVRAIADSASGIAEA